jgi:MtN3 and saliva related transmembrane protein
MGLELQDYVGFIGGVFSSVSFLPQVIKLWKTRSAKDLSMMTLLFLIMNVCTWLTYGVLIHAWPLIVTNGIVLSMVLIMVYFKLTFKE